MFLGTQLRFWGSTGALERGCTSVNVLDMVLGPPGKWSKRRVLYSVFFTTAGERTRAAAFSRPSLTHPTAPRPLFPFIRQVTGAPDSGFGAGLPLLMRRGRFWKSAWNESAVAFVATQAATLCLPSAPTGPFSPQPGFCCAAAPGNVTDHSMLTNLHCVILL